MIPPEKQRCELTTDAGKRQAAEELSDSVRDRLPEGLARPALRALAAAGYTSLTQFTQATEDELKKLHGMGPKAIRTIRAALEEEGLSLAERDVRK